MELSPLGRSAGDLTFEPGDAPDISYYVQHQMLAHALLGGGGDSQCRSEVHQRNEDLDRCGDVKR